MEATTIVAIIGAVTGSASLAIQAASWLGTRTKLDLEVNPGKAPFPGSEIDEGGNTIPEDRDVVFIQITNHSPHPVKVSNLGAWDAADKKQGLVFPQPIPFNKLPVPIGARDYVLVWVKREGLLADRQRRFRFYAKTATGKVKKTRKLALDKRPHYESV